MVNSATWEHSDGDVKYYPHTEYSLYSTAGRLVQNVRNHISSQDENAECLSLPPGSYVVFAESETEGRVRVPVRIATGRLTEVNLERPRRK